MEGQPKDKPKLLSWADFPEGMNRFNLDPTGVQLNPQELFPGVYVLVSSKGGVNHTGFVVGRKGVLVVDAHINVAMARQIQRAIQTVTNKPMLFLVNANHHGDHTFGNCAFHPETLIVQQRRTAELTPYFAEEKAFLLSSVGNDPEKIFEGVELRLPDIVFDSYLRFDLGGITVETHYFGPGNAPGDTVTYIPEGKIAFTGNMTGSTMVLTLWTDAPTYLNSLSKFAQTLAVDTLIPSHTPRTTGEVIGQELHYLADLNNEVMKAVQAGWSMEEAQERIALKENFLPPPERRGPFNYGNNHKYNIMRTYKSLVSEKKGLGI